MSCLNLVFAKQKLSAGQCEILIYMLIFPLDNWFKTRSPWVRSGPPPVVNKVLLEHSHTRLFMFFLLLLWSHRGRVVVQEQTSFQA